MRIINSFPPNYEQICKYFPVRNKQGVIFTYKNVLYVPSGAQIPEHLMKHEETHALQQKEMGVDVWWERYFKDKKFGLSQELEAYRNQYQYAKKFLGRRESRRILKYISKDLSSGMYGNLVSKEEAKRLICQRKIS